MDLCWLALFQARASESFHLQSKDLKEQGSGVPYFPFGSLPEFMNLKLFGKTILVVNIKFELFWAIHSASELLDLHKEVILRFVGHQRAATS